MTRSRLAGKATALAILVTAAAAAPVSCSAAGSDPASGGSGGASGGAGAGGAGFDASFLDSSGQDSTLTEANACAADSFTGEPVPLDMYIMLDQSGSMDDPVPGGTKWGLVTSALKSFVTQPLADGIGVGIQYFPYPGTGIYCTDATDCWVKNGVGNCFGGQCLVGSNSGCKVPLYAAPDVAFGVLPGNATALKSSLLKHSPAGGTPTTPAMQGAVQYATSWANTHLDHKVIIVLATDGDPAGCDSTVGNAAGVALDAFAATPSIPTYVIGVGDLQANLDQIADAGGTTKAFIIDPTKPTVEDDFLKAMNAIRGAALGCEFFIPTPEAGVFDPKKANVHYTPGGGGAGQTLPNAKAGKADCGSDDGWYYNDPTTPTRIELCDASCQKVEADSAAKIDILLGCQIILK